MKIIIAAFALLALAAAVPVENEKHEVKVVREEHHQNPDGSYSFTYETDDGTVRREEGKLKEVLDEKKEPHIVVVVRGLYTYVDKEGKSETIEYNADELGYKPTGDSIPKQEGLSSRR